MKRILLFSIVLCAALATVSCTADNLDEASNKQNVNQTDTGGTGGTTSNPKP